MKTVTIYQPDPGEWRVGFYGQCSGSPGNLSGPCEQCTYKMMPELLEPIKL